MTKELEKKYNKKQMVKILKRLVDSLNKSKKFRMQIKGQKVYVPQGVEIEMEYEKETKPSKAGSSDTFKKVFRKKR
jgi:hypothetical protein